MKIKVHNQTIDKQRCFTFYFEDVPTNTLIHSDTFVRVVGTNYNKLKAEFIDYVKSMMEKEFEILDSNKISLN